MVVSQLGLIWELRRNNDEKSMTFVFVSQDGKSGRRVFGDKDEDRMTVLLAVCVSFSLVNLLETDR